MRIPPQSLPIVPFTRRKKGRQTRPLFWLILVLGAIAQGCSGGSDDRIEPVSVSTSLIIEPTVLLTVAPQSDHVFLSWSTATGATSYRIEWGPTLSDRWQARVVTGTTSVATSVPNSENYKFRVIALDGQSELARSAEVRSAAAPRANCAFVGYIPWLPRVSFFCSWAALDGWLQDEGLDRSQLKCRNQPITHWDESVPDCYYTIDQHEILLLRNANSTFSQRPVSSAATVRAAVRLALWGSLDPFATNQKTPLVPAKTTHTGSVRQSSESTGYLVEPMRIPGVASRITVFHPRSPRPGRVAIYHEGHGGAAVDIGAETIDWLLDRGWVVFAMDMPLTGANEVDLRPGLSSHNDFNRFDDGQTSPLTTFVTPVKAVVDHIFAQAAPGEEPFILMIGRSGGGWITYTYGALDPRIALVVPVAGGRPLSQRLDAPWGALEVGRLTNSPPARLQQGGTRTIAYSSGQPRWSAYVQRDGPVLL